MTQFIKHYMNAVTKITKAFEHNPETCKKISFILITMQITSFLANIVSLALFIYTIAYTFRVEHSLL